MKKKWENLQINELIFRDLKYYVSGEISVKADALLKEGGGERLNYFSHCVTHCIVGNNALESDITDATELYEIPALREEWVFFSVYCNKLLSTEGFIAGTNCLFANVTACISGLSKMDANKLWAMVTFHGGKVQSLFNRSCTHLITSKKEGAKYKRAVRHGRFIRTVTPDWVVDSVRGGIRCQEGLYHPRLLISPKPCTSTPQTTLIGADACSNPAANMSTAQILGFTDDDMDTGQLLVSSSKASAMEQLRQRMPWNQPTSNQPKIPTSTAITGSPSLQEQLQQFHLVQQRLAEAEISSSLSPAQGVPHEGHHQQEVTTQNIHKALGPPVATNQIGMLQKTLVAPSLHQVLHTSWKQVVLPGLNQKQQQSILQNDPQIVIQQSPSQAVSLQQGETLRGPSGHQPLEQQQFQPPHSQQQYFHIQKPQQQQHLLQQKLHPRQLLQQQPQVQNSQQLLQQQQLQAQNAHQRMQQQQELKLQSQNSQQLLQQQQELKLHPQNSQQLLQQQQELKLHSQNSQQLLQQQQELKLHSQNSQQLLQQHQELKLHSQNSQQLLQQQQELKLHSQNSQQLLQQQQELKLQSHNPQQMLQLQLRAPNPQQILQQQEQKFHFQQQHRELKFQSQNPRQLLQQHLRAQSSQQLLQQQEQKLHTQHLLQQQHQQQQLQVQKSQQMLQQHQQQQLQAQMSQKLLQEQHLQSQNPQHQEEQQLSGQNSKQQLQQQLTAQNIQQRLQQQLQAQSPHQQAQQFHAQNSQQLLQQQQHLQNKNSQQILQQQHQLQNKNALQQQQEQKHHQFQQQNPQQLPQQNLQQQLPQQNLQQQYHTQNSRQQLHHQRFQPETSQQQQQQQLHVLNVRQHLEQFAAQNSQRLQQRQIPTPKPQQQFLPQSPQHHYQLQQQQQQLQPPNPQTQLQFQAQKPMQQRQQLAPEEALQQQQQPAPGTSQPQQLQRRYGLSNITNSDERLSSCVVSSTTSTSASQRQSRVQLFTGQNSNLKFTPELCLLGCVIHILDYDLTYTDNIATWKKIITDHGGHVEESYGPAVTHIICEKLSSAVAQQALKDGKRCVSGYWLNDVLFKMQVLPPWIALHFPTNLRNDKPCKHLIISISGFQDDDKCRVVFMIESIGAKYTAYFSSQNNILVCRKPQGKKYDKALEWKTPVVNTQWLSDIFLGHYKAIQQPDSPKYKIFNTPNLFKVEYGLIPHLMVAWKQPLSITQELYNKATLNPPVKKRRLEKTSSVMVAPAVIEVSLAQVEAAQKEGKPRVVLSYVNDQDTIVKRVTNLGGVVVNDVEQATHLVMSKDTITIKLVLAISLGIFIVSDSWVADSSAHQTFQDEKGYVLQTDNLKLSYDISLADTLNKPNRNEFLKGKTFYVTHGVKPSRRILHKVIETAGGSAEKEMRSFVRLKEANAVNLYIVSAENDMHLLSRFSNSIGIFHPNALIWSIVTQKFILDNAEEKVPS